jgi:hypothetical protein
MVHFTHDGGDDDDQNTKNDAHPAGVESGDYSLPPDIGERIGEGDDHDPASLGDVGNG